jgi:hypothetical protein
MKELNTIQKQMIYKLILVTSQNYYLRGFNGLIYI